MSFAVPSPDWDPLALFASWYEAAATDDAEARDTIYLATAMPDGQPSVRPVLYRGMREGKLSWFTSYGSRKAQQLEQNARAALCFHWAWCKRVVRVEGSVSRLSAAESDAYFASRGRQSQLSALVSPQSRAVDPAQLEWQRAAAARRYAGQPVPRPESWGGYGLTPERLELWVNGPARFHRRYLYELRAGAWAFSRLAP